MVGDDTDIGASPVTRVAVIDDHELVRDGLRMLLDGQPDLQVVAQAGSVAEGISGIERCQPDVAIVDVQLPDGSGIEVCRAAHERSPGTRCLVLTSLTHDEALFDAVLAGAAGYVLKQVRSAELLSCVRRVAEGRLLIDERSARRLRERVRADGESDPRLAMLSDRERRVLQHVTDGLTNREIADEMVLSDKTVKNYVSNILTKLGMKRRSEVAALGAAAQARRAIVGMPAPGEAEAIRY